MRVERARIIVTFETNNLRQILNNRKTNIYYVSTKENYAIVYCDKREENKILQLIKDSSSVLDAVISSERLDKLNF